MPSPRYGQATTVLPTRRQYQPMGMGTDLLDTPHLKYPPVARIPCPEPQNPSSPCQKPTRLLSLVCVSHPTRPIPSSQVLLTCSSLTSSRRRTSADKRRYAKSILIRLPVCAGECEVERVRIARKPLRITCPSLRVRPSLSRLARDGIARKRKILGGLPPTPPASGQFPTRELR